MGSNFTRGTAGDAAFSRASAPSAGFQTDLPGKPDRVRPTVYGSWKYGIGKYTSKDVTRYLWSRVKAALLGAAVAVLLPAPARALTTNTVCSASDSRTTNLDLCLPQVDAEDPNIFWGDKNNNNFQRLDDAYSQTVSSMTNLNASNLTSGTVPNARLSGTYSSASIGGNAATATALQSAPSAAGSGYVCRGVDVSGNCLTAAVDAAGVLSSTNPVQSGALYSHAALTGSSAHGATSANTASQIVARDGSGNFSAGTITASLTGHSSLDLPLTGGTIAGSMTVVSGLTASSGTFTATGASQYSLSASSGIDVVAGGVTAPFFSGSLNASNLTGTVPNERLDSTSVTFQGNGVNGPSQLVRLDGSSRLPAVDGSQLTNVTAHAVSTNAIVAAGTVVGTYSIGAPTTGATWDGHLWWVTTATNLISISTVGAQVSCSSSSWSNLQGVEYNPVNGYLYVNNYSSKTVDVMTSSCVFVTRVDLSADSGGPQDIAFDGYGRGYVAENESYHTVVLSSGPTIMRVGYFSNDYDHWQICQDGRSAWSTSSSGYMVRTDSATGGQYWITSITGGQQTVACDGSHVFMTGYDGTNTKLLSFDPIAKSSVTYNIFGSNLGNTQRAKYDGLGNIWITTTDTGYLWQVNADSPTVVSKFSGMCPSGGTCPMAWNGTDLLIANDASNTVLLVAGVYGANISPIDAADPLKLIQKRLGPSRANTQIPSGYATCKVESTVAGSYQLDGHCLTTLTNGACTCVAP